jgi:predicted nucleic acid-binding protein
LEDAVLDSDALIEAYDIGIEKFGGVRTTHISLYEFLRGLSYLGKQVGEYKAYLEANVGMLGLDNRAIVTAADVYARLRKRGSLVDDPDLLIASICIANGLPIVTGNVKHFERFKEFGLSLKEKDQFLSSARGR